MLTREVLFSPLDTLNSCIFFLEGTVTNPAIWLVLSAVRIFLFLQRVISSIYVARKYLLIFSKQKSIFSAPNWPSRLGSQAVFYTFSDLTPQVFETDLVIDADNGFLFERTLKSGWSCTWMLILDLHLWLNLPTYGVTEFCRIIVLMNTNKVKRSQEKTTLALATTFFSTLRFTRKVWMNLSHCQNFGWNINCI